MTNALQELVDQDEPIAVTRLTAYSDGETSEISGLFDVIDYVYGSPGQEDCVVLVPRTHGLRAYAAEPMLVLEQARPHLYGELLRSERELELMLEEQPC